MLCYFYYLCAKLIRIVTSIERTLPQAPPSSMASKRQLKKDVIAEVMRLFDEALIIRSVADSEAMQRELEDLMDDIMVFTDDTLRRIDHPDGKDTPALVKGYYRALRQHIAENATHISDRLDQFIEGL